RLAPFPLVGATTRPGMLSAPLRERFGIFHHLDFYSETELARIVTRSAAILESPVDAAGAREIARRARGTPRIVNRLLRRVRDYALVHGHKVITDPVARSSLDREGVDARGLGQLDRRFLSATSAHSGEGPRGAAAARRARRISTSARSRPRRRDRRACSSERRARHRPDARRLRAPDRARRRRTGARRPGALARPAAGRHPHPARQLDLLLPARHVTPAERGPHLDPVDPGPAVRTVRAVLIAILGFAALPVPPAYASSTIRVAIVENARGVELHGVSSEVNELGGSGTDASAWRTGVVRAVAAGPSVEIDGRR